jgi:site-specific DNA recombinase
VRSERVTEAGGTPGKAPVGYRNTRRLEDGREIRTVEVDPQRAPLVRWAFECYASGDWRIQPLVEELTRRGLDVPATRSKPAKPLGVSRLHAMLRNAYYKGLVLYCGVEYQGTHEPLIDAATWQRVQDVLTAHNHAGEKQRRHNHYLKSSLFCGRCGSRMIVTHSLSHTGRRYAYFTCISKHQKRNGCTMRAVSMQRVEDLVAEHYLTIKLPPGIREILEPGLRDDLDAHYAEARAQHDRLNETRSKLLDQRTKLLEAHYAGAIPLELLRIEQQRISHELDSIAAKIAETEDHQTLVETNLARALDLATDCHEAYIGAPARIKRWFNQIFFSKLYIEDETIRSEPSTAFAQIAHASNRKGVDWAAWEVSLNTSDPVAGVASVKEPNLVAGAGFEPATSGL